MSLLDTFRSLPTARLKLGTLPRWMSVSRFQLPSGSVSRRNPELLPAGAALLLFLIAGFQMTLSSSVELPDDTVSAPRRALETPAPAPKSYPGPYPAGLLGPGRT